MNSQNIIYVVDTNTLLDAFLSRNDAKQIRAVLKQAEQSECLLWVPVVVFFELAWVLSSFYKKDKTYVVMLLSDLLELPGVVTEQKESLIRALSLYAVHSSITMTDAYILSVALHTRPKDFLTQDKKLVRLYSKLSKD